MKNIMVSLMLVVNIVLMLLFLADMYVINNKNSQPKLKSAICVVLMIFFVLYLISCGIFGFYGILSLDLRYLIFIIYLVIPFILGRFVKHKNLKSYSVLQLMAYVASLLTLIDLK